MSGLRWIEEPPASHPDWDGPLPTQGSRWAVTDLTGLYQLQGSRAPLGAVVRWLDANPGCWALVGTYDLLSSKRSRLAGWNEASLSKRGLPVRMHEGNVYAQSVSKEAHELERVLAFLAGETMDGFELPRLERDKFDWSLAELLTAAETARNWLFPSVSHAAA
jgi:hypothetical protein